MPAMNTLFYGKILSILTQQQLAELGAFQIMLDAGISTPETATKATRTTARAARTTRRKAATRTRNTGPSALTTAITALYAGNPQASYTAKELRDALTNATGKTWSQAGVRNAAVKMSKGQKRALTKTGNRWTASNIVAVNPASRSRRSGPPTPRSAGTTAEQRQAATG